MIKSDTLHLRHKASIAPGACLREVAAVDVSDFRWTISNVLPAKLS
jgi:hypothetical protein